MSSTFRPFFIQPAFRNMKLGRGGNDWRRFFALMSIDLAMREQMPLVPGTPINRSELKDELQELASRLRVLTQMKAWNKWLSVTPDAKLNAAGVILLKLDFENKKPNRDSVCGKSVG